MTVEKAVKILKANDERRIASFYVRIKDLAIKALEKQIPQKPNFQGDGYADGELVYDYAECPVCGCDFEEETRDWGCKFCPDCGHALDWGGVRMTDAEIIKSLECCRKSPPECIECKYKGKCNRIDCYDYLKRDALDLINRQRAEIEKITNHILDVTKMMKAKDDEIEVAKAEIERLEQNLEEAHIDIKEHQAHIRNLKMVIDKIEDHINPLPFETDYDKAIRIAKAEAVKELCEIIYSLVKEMAGERNETILL